MFVEVRAKSVHNGSLKSFYLNLLHIVFAYEDDGAVTLELRDGKRLFMLKDDWQSLKQRIEADQRKQWK